MMHLIGRSDLDDITIRQQNETSDIERMKSTTRELPARYYGSWTRCWLSRNRGLRTPTPSSCLERLPRVDQGWYPHRRKGAALGISRRVVML